MGHMKNFDIRIRSGGDDAIAAVGELTAHLEGEIERLRLTDAEREAVQAVTNHYQKLCDDYAPICEEDENTLVTLRGLLERTK